MLPNPKASAQDVCLTSCSEQMTWCEHEALIMLAMCKLRAGGNIDRRLLCDEEFDSSPTILACENTNDVCVAACDDKPAS